MNIKYVKRRDFIKYGLISSFFFFSGCSRSKEKLALRGFEKSFTNEFINTLPSSWEFIPIKKIEPKNFTYSSILEDKTDLLVLDDGWISDLPYTSLKEIKADNIKDNFNDQANSFLFDLGENYKNKILPLAVSPWVILFRNEESLILKNKYSWEVILSEDLAGQIIFPTSPYLLISIANKIGIYNDFSNIKKQAKAFDDRNAINWLVSSRARAAVLPLSHCVQSLSQDPRLSVLLPRDGSPLNWTVVASPKFSSETFPETWFDSLWEANHAKRLIRKGFLPPNDLADLRRINKNQFQKYQSVFLPEDNTWSKCWSLPILDLENQKKLALTWNKS